VTSGIDLSVGMVFVLANCLASHLVVGTPLQAALGVVVVLAVGALCGAINGVIIVYGRLQPIITTLATGTVYFGLALGLRPVPGGEVHADLADALTGAQLAGIPSLMLVLVAVVLVIWVPYRRSTIGRAALAIGSAEGAAYMSGVPIGRAKIVTYTLAGLLAAIGGLLLTFVTYSGEASSAIGGTYTLNSIAAVVIGGTSLAGGAGSAIGSIFGAFVLRTIGDLLFVFDLEPLWQPLFQGIILLVAVSLGALHLLKVTNRLELFK
jgi:ribose transport system permease protein